MGAKSSALARLFVIVGVEVEAGINEGVEVEGLRRDSRDGTGLGVGVWVGVDAERIERPLGMADGAGTIGVSRVVGREVVARARMFRVEVDA